MVTLAFRALEEDLVVYVAGDAAPDQAEWQAYVQHAEDVAQRWRGKSTLYKYFVFVDDGAPNATQRAAVWQALKGTPSRAAIVTTGLVARKIVTAFGWMGAPMRGFAPRDLEAAAKYLELSPERLPGVVAIARTLASAVGGVRAVAALADDVASAS